MGLPAGAFSENALAERTMMSFTECKLLNCVCSCRSPRSPKWFCADFTIPSRLAFFSRHANSPGFASSQCMRPLRGMRIELARGVSGHEVASSEGLLRH